MLGSLFKKAKGLCGASKDFKKAFKAFLKSKALQRLISLLKRNSNCLFPVKLARSLRTPNGIWKEISAIIRGLLIFSWGIERDK